MYIHLEGMDLAGKSTVCRRLAAHLGSCVVRRNSIAESNPACDVVDTLRRQAGVPDDSLGWLYYAVMLADFSLYERPPGDAIQDSTILLRSLAFHEARGSEDRLVEAFRTALSTHPRFTATFVLKASHERRLERLAKRRKENLSPEDFLVRDQPNLFYRMEELLIEYAQQHFQARILDTTDLECTDASARLITEMIAMAEAAASSTMENQQ